VSVRILGTCHGVTVLQSRMKVDDERHLG
jgi:hypothetical protein